jgi:ERCC4-type nuclease
MDFKCQVCGAETGSFSTLHRHIKKDHGLIPRDYYPLFFNRRDLFDGELIEFKDIKQYFSTNFNSKYNFLKWIAPGGKEVQDYSINILKERAEEKQTNLIPSHVEMKSLFVPCLSDYITMFKGVENLKSNLRTVGLEMKLQTEIPEFKSGPMNVYVDTREQTPLNFGQASEVKKLIVGDYCPSEEFFCNVFVERKSIYDLAGTLTKGIERFAKEVERAAELGIYLVVVTECSFIDAFEYSPKNSFSQKIGGAFLFNKLRKFMTDYNNIQFVFAPNRYRSVEIIDKIFRMGEAAKTTDLEYLKDRGLL